LPLSHAKLAAFYLQLSQQLGAGLTLAQALSERSSAPADDCASLVSQIENGATVATLFTSAGDWLPNEDRPFLIAAAETGKLPIILKALSQRHELLGAQQSRMIFSSLYPLGVLHFGALVFSFFRLINWEKGLQWSTLGFIGGVLMIILPFWTGAIVLTVLVRRRNPLALKFLDLLPAVGGFRRHQALADFAFSLGHLLEAGAPIGSAWKQAGKIANSPRIEVAAQAICSAIDSGTAPGTLLKSHAVFPDEFVTLYRTGERSGSLDQNLLHLAELHFERAQKQLKLAAALYPGLLFFAVAGLVLYIVVSSYAGYLKSITDMLN
jgi:type II secretory pathway component PulF